MWGRSHTGRTTRLMYGRDYGKTKLIHFYSRKKKLKLPVGGLLHPRYKFPWNSCLKQPKAIMGHIQRCPGQNMWKWNACTSQRARTLAHYRAGHQESFRKLALSAFPVRPSDGSPLFLETEDRPHPQTQQLQGHENPWHGQSRSLLLSFNSNLHTKATDSFCICWMNLTKEKWREGVSSLYLTFSHFFFYVLWRGQHRNRDTHTHTQREDFFRAFT